MKNFLIKYLKQLIGRFAFAEASSCIAQTTTNLTSPIFFSDSSNCISFYYNLYGSDIGTLKVYLITKTSMSTKVILNKSNRKKDEWVKHTIEFKNPGIYQVIIIKIHKNSFFEVN